MKTKKEKEVVKKTIEMYDNEKRRIKQEIKNIKKEKKKITKQIDKYITYIEVNGKK